MTDAFQDELAERVAQFLVAHAANGEHPPSEWAAETGLPFVAALSREDADECARELTAALHDAEQRGNMENLAGEVRAWASTVSIREDPVVLAAMTADVDPTQVVEVLPPSEADVRTAESEVGE